MPMREVRVYDGDFPTMEQMISGDSSATHPKECWLHQMQRGEFAVRYKDFKTGIPRHPSGERGRAPEICRIFDTLQEAREDSRRVSATDWTIRCFIYDHTGTQIDTVSNNKQVSKFAVATYAGILFYIAALALPGMAAIWLLYQLSLAILGPSTFAHHPSWDSGWLYWATYIFAGLLLGIAYWYLRLKIKFGRTGSRMQKNLNAALTPEDKKRFSALNHLYGSTDPAIQEHYKKLLREYQEKIVQAMKK